VIPTPKSAKPRRWSHRLRHSLRWRLLALFLMLALALSAAFVGGVQKSFAVGWRDAVRPLLSDYVDRLTAEIGTPPDVARAQALVARLPISVRIEGPAVQFDSHPNKADEPWHHRNSNDRTHDYSGYGQDRANARLLLRTTADGHTIRFGLGDLNWRRGPGGFVWITLTALLLLTALAFAYIRRLLKPLDDIGAGAQRFGAGDFSQPIAVRRRDELGDLADQINTMGQDIHQMLEAKRGLLLAISHELRSPLTRARLNTELLPETTDIAVQRSALLRDLAEMSRLITDLLESERLSGSHAALHREPTDLAALINEVVDEMKRAPVQAAAAGVKIPRFVVNTATDLPLVALDRVRIRLLLRNLLDNAVRHSPAEGKSEDALIEISLTQINPTDDGNHLRLSVRDHGAGVSESQLAQLAEPFFRTDAGRQRSTGGVGLGLYLCRLVAQAHGGRLILQNAHPGLVVIATLPFKTNL
jgi:signal transduction histidine kinase